MGSNTTTGRASDGDSHPEIESERCRPLNPKNAHQARQLHPAKGRLYRGYISTLLSVPPAPQVGGRRAARRHERQAGGPWRARASRTLSARRCSGCAASCRGARRRSAPTVRRGSVRAARCAPPAPSRWQRTPLAGHGCGRSGDKATRRAAPRGSAPRGTRTTLSRGKSTSQVLALLRRARRATPAPTPRARLCMHTLSLRAERCLAVQYTGSCRGVGECGRVLHRSLLCRPRER